MSILFIERSKLRKALKPIVDASKSNGIGWSPSNDHQDWNETAHLNITITIAEARAVRDLLHPPRLKSKSGCHMCDNGLPLDADGIHEDCFGEKATCEKIKH